MLLNLFNTKVQKASVITATHTALYCPFEGLSKSTCLAMTLTNDPSEVITIFWLFLIVMISTCYGPLIIYTSLIKYSSQSLIWLSGLAIDLLACSIFHAYYRCSNSLAAMELIGNQLT